MIGGRKKQKKKSLRSRIANKMSDPAEFEKKQHEANFANAGLFIKHSLNTVMVSGAYRALLVILEAVRHWPASIANTGSDAFVPEFNANDISAEEVVKGDTTVINVSFTYSDRRYDFSCKVDMDSSMDHTPGAITLHEDGDWVIRMDIIKKQNSNQFEYQELTAFRNGSWVENVVQIASEIETHNSRLAYTAD
jgi:hypothetical protein